VGLSPHRAPARFRRGLSHGDHPALNLGIADLLTRGVHIIAIPTALPGEPDQGPRRHPDLRLLT
jgi:hypothetical protein